MFESIVKLYRAIGSPAIQDDLLVYDGVYSDEISAAIRACKALSPAYGNFEHLSEERYSIEFEYRLPSSEVGRFFPDLEAFILGSASLSKGLFPRNIFIVSEGWADSDEHKPLKIIRLERICHLVQLLSLLAVGFDKDSNTDCYSLFFALPPDGARPPRSFLLPTNIVAGMLQYEVQHLNLLEEILNKKNENKAHLSERKLMLRLAVADVLDKFESESNMFLVLVREWKSVLSQYRNNLQTYVHGFSFEKVRREVAQAEIDYGTKLSSVLGDIAGKLLALPVSLVALVALQKTDSPFESFVLFLSLVLVTVVLLSVLYNQKLQVDRLMHSFDVVFDEFKGKVETYPQKLQKLLKLTIKQVDDQGEVLKKTFMLLQVASCVPAYLGFMVVVYKYGDSALVFLRWIFHIFVK